MEIQLQSILMPSEEICKVSELYYHENNGQINFDGYFNLFYIEKRKAYTNIEKLFLSLRLKGFSSLALYRNREKLQEVSLEAEKEKTYKIPLPYAEHKDGVFWFALTRETEDAIVSGMYIGETAEDQVRPVNIGIDICTYRREPYVLKNLIRLTERVLNRRDLKVSSHVQIYVVDNGKTLNNHQDIQEICENSQGKIRIFSNKNAGGAGGFTRGMLEILAEKEAYGTTHVLLMDDDAIVEPDALIRLFGILSTLRPKWQNATIGGALMREDYPHLLFCAGELWENGEIKHPKKNLDVRSFGIASCDYLIKTGNEYSWYSGWWCCCYPLTVVREDNLPLPLFIHEDDIEYGLRNQSKGVLFFNGIGVWHKGFEIAFGSSTLYYDIRNQLITIALHGTGDIKRAALKFVMKSLTVAVIRMRYQDADAVYQGFLDFLKGSKWLWRQEPETLNQQVREKSSQYQPVERILEELPENERREVQKQIDSFWDRFSEDMVLNGARYGQKSTLLHYLTFNGWFLPSDGTGIKLLTPLDSLWEVFRKKRVVWYEPASKRALLAKRDYRELKRMAGLYGKTWIAFHRHMERACQAYQKSALMNANSLRWKEYLKER